MLLISRCWRELAPLRRSRRSWRSWTTRSAKPGIRLKAAEMILDRAWGKAAPAPAETPDNKPITTQLEVLSEAEAAAIRLKVNGGTP